MRTSTVPDRGEVWTEEEATSVLERWQRSGESIAGFARRHGMSPARLYWWRKRLGWTGGSGSLTLVPAVVTTTTSTAAVVIRVREEITVEIANASPSWIAAMVVELARSRP